MRRFRNPIWFAAALVAVLAMAVTPGRAQAMPTTFVGHVDVGPYAALLLPVETRDLAPYVPEGFRIVEAGGRTSLIISFGPWTNISADLEGGASLHDAGPFWEADYLVPTYGPEGGSPEDGGVLGLWRLAGSSVLPAALGTLGVTCATPTKACHVPAMTGSVTTSPAATTLQISVPWETSPHTMSATYVPTTLPCAFCNPALVGWHLGARGRVKETVFWSDFPKGAITGLGTGTVYAPKGTPLYEILGDQEQATAAVVVLGAHLDGVFELM